MKTREQLWEEWQSLQFMLQQLPSVIQNDCTLKPEDLEFFIERSKMFQDLYYITSIQTLDLAKTMVGPPPEETNDEQ